MFCWSASVFWKPKDVGSIDVATHIQKKSNLNPLTKCSWPGCRSKEGRIIFSEKSKASWIKYPDGFRFAVLCRLQYRLNCTETYCRCLSPVCEMASLALGSYSCSAVFFTWVNMSQKSLPFFIGLNVGIFVSKHSYIIILCATVLVALRNQLLMEKHCPWFLSNPTHRYDQFINWFCSCISYSFLYVINFSQNEPCINFCYWCI